MSVTLYGISGSPFVWRVMLALESKEVDYKLTTVEMSEGENQADWYLAMNPRGKVPVLKDGDTVVYESIAILSYLERKYPQPALFGSTAEHHANIMRMLMEINCYMETETLQIVRPIFFGGVEEAREEITQATARIQQELGVLDILLEGQKWLVGEEISAVDISLYPLLKIQQRALGKPEAGVLDLTFNPISEQYSNILRWSQLIEDLHYFKKTWPSHWDAA